MALDSEYNGDLEAAFIKMANSHFVQLNESATTTLEIKA